jgi:hypothetical protein
MTWYDTLLGLIKPKCLDWMKDATFINTFVKVISCREARYNDYPIGYSNYFTRSGIYIRTLDYRQTNTQQCLKSCTIDV